MLSRNLPYQHLKTDVRVILAIVQKELPKRPTGKLTDQARKTLWNLCEKCWAHEPEGRVTIQEVLGILSAITSATKPCGDKTAKQKMSQQERASHSSRSRKSQQVTSVSDRNNCLLARRIGSSDSWP